MGSTANRDTPEQIVTMRRSAALPPRPGGATQIAIGIEKAAPKGGLFSADGRT